MIDKIDPTVSVTVFSQAPQKSINNHHHHHHHHHHHNDNHPNNNKNQKYILIDDLSNEQDNYNLKCVRV